MAYSPKFGEEVARAIGEAKQRDLAQKMRASQTIVTHMVNGRIVSDEYIRRFANAIGQDPEEWIRKARLYREEVHLRDLGFLTDNDVSAIMRIMEEAEKAEEEKTRR